MEATAQTRTILPEYWIEKTAFELQKNLNMFALIHNFAQELIPMVSYAGLRYEYAPLEFDTLVGEQAKYYSASRLSLEDEFLGSICFYSRIGFSYEDEEILRACVQALLYPLCNGIRYAKALKASRHDALTGVGNREALQTYLNQLHEEALRFNQPFSLLVCDVDGFKHINDQFGHMTGDKVLSLLVQMVRQSIRTSDRLFRYGGDEFVVVLPQTDEPGAQIAAERVRDNMAKARRVQPELPAFTVSVGGAVLGRFESLESLFKRADEALYQCKSTGKNRYMVVS